MGVNFRLDGKRILITGASSGLGRSIAIEASQMGGRVALIGRNEERLRETASNCAHDPIVLPYDLTDDLDGLPKLVRNWAKEFGPFSGLVHSAGVCPFVPLRALKSSHFIDSYRLNVVAGVLLVKGLATKGCYRENETSAIFISSIMGHKGQAGIIAYCASKGAVESATRSLALELRPVGIRVNAIAPSIMKTPMVTEVSSFLTSEAQANLVASMSGGLGEPSDVAAAALYLLSDASRFVTGTSLLVDGGHCA